MEPESENRFRQGMIYGLVAYLCWGLVPLYFAQLKMIPAGEILAHRISWSVALMALLTTLNGGWPELLRVLRNRKLMLTLLLSATLLSINWLLYIYATVINRVSEASLGYYIMPLVNAFLGTVFLGERLRIAHYPALAMVAIGVSIPLAAAGTFPILAIALPVTFGFYGLVRKMVKVESLTGLTVESLILLGPSLLYLIWQNQEGTGHFGQSLRFDFLLAFSAIVTVVPLLTFTLSIRRLPLIAVSFIQVLSPSVQFLLAVGVLEEAISREQWAAIGCVWAAVLIFLIDAFWQMWAIPVPVLEPIAVLAEDRS